MSLKHLDLLFPQWQGNGLSGIYDGARAIGHAQKKSFVEIPVNAKEDLTCDHDINGYPSVLAQLRTARKQVLETAPDTIMTVGGDCSVDLAPLSYLNRKYGQDLQLLWVDAHGDLHTPASSPSKNFHGMPLRMLLGEGEPTVQSQLFSTFKPEQVVMVGVRDLDVAEEKYVAERDIRVFSSQEIRQKGYDQVFSTLASRNFGHLYVHFDLDVLDAFPYVRYSIPGGLPYPGVVKFLADLKSTYTSVGFALTEYLPGKGTEGMQEIQEILELDLINL